MPHLFLSYAREDKPHVAEFVRLLEERGFDVWWDKDLNAGDAFSDVIEEKIDAALCVVVAWSKHSRKSRWVRAESLLGFDAGKLVQVMVEPVRLPLPFYGLHASQLSTDPNTDEWREIERSVRGFHSPSPEPTPNANASKGGTELMSADRLVTLLTWAALVALACVTVIVTFSPLESAERIRTLYAGGAAAGFFASWALLLTVRRMIALSRGRAA